MTRPAPRVKAAQLAYQRRKRAGQCVKCAQARAPGHVLCLEHLARHRAWGRDKVLQGVCSGCSAPLDSVFVRCSRCRERENRTRRALRLQRKQAGLCVDCGRQPAFLTHSLCEEHYQRAKKAYLRFERRRQRLAKEPA